MAERTHLSIGEVLSLLREEFPDVTISKIRFLESQGLVDPERTPSGYRKFYEHDVERLRWILRQQRENFLPLKIIRGRLTEQGDELEEGAPLGESDGMPLEETVAEVAIETASSTHPAAATRQRQSGSGPVPSEPAGEAGLPNGPGEAIPGRPEAGATSPAGSAPASRPGPGAPLPATGGRDPRRGRTSPDMQAALGEEAETFSAEELAAACGGTVAMVTDLQQYGLISSRVVVGGTPYFDAAALDVARAAAGFFRHGVEPRHLRAWRNAADREAGIFEQVIVPLLRQRNPDARRQAAATLSELASLGADLRKALVDQALRQIR
jgi:DNA-binding transcriptional MerR regulator